jgi:hypothetical protein
VSIEFAVYRRHSSDIVEFRESDQWSELLSETLEFVHSREIQ